MPVTKNTPGHIDIATANKETTLPRRSPRIREKADAVASGIDKSAKQQRQPATPRTPRSPRTPTTPRTPSGKKKVTFKDKVDQAPHVDVTTPKGRGFVASFDMREAPSTIVPSTTTADRDSDIDMTETPLGTKESASDHRSILEDAAQSYLRADAIPQFKLEQAEPDHSVDYINKQPPDLETGAGKQQFRLKQAEPDRLVDDIYKQHSGNKSLPSRFQHAPRLEYGEVLYQGRSTKIKGLYQVGVRSMFFLETEHGPGQYGGRSYIIVPTSSIEDVDVANYRTKQYEIERGSMRKDTKGRFITGDVAYAPFPEKRSRISSGKRRGPPPNPWQFVECLHLKPDGSQTTQWYTFSDFSTRYGRTVAQEKMDRACLLAGTTTLQDRKEAARARQRKLTASTEAQRPPPARESEEWSEPPPDQVEGRFRRDNNTMFVGRDEEIDDDDDDDDGGYY